MYFEQNGGTVVVLGVVLRLLLLSITDWSGLVWSGLVWSGLACTARGRGDQVESGMSRSGRKMYVFVCFFVFPLHPIPSGFPFPFFIC